MEVYFHAIVFIETHLTIIQSINFNSVNAEHFKNFYLLSLILTFVHKIKRNSYMFL